ncbi:MAG: chemotaxis protein CheW [Archangium sp.]|nr:chemotaxis protein CheW [Archangium sp.]
MNAMREGASGKWATFILAGEMFALEVENVQEVLMQQPLTPVPRAPEHIVGLLNLRGQIISAIDLRRRLHFPARAEGQTTKLLVVTAGGSQFSVVVDDIHDVLELPPERWRPTPETLEQSHRAFVRAICPIDGHMVLGLDVEALGEDTARAGGAA